MPSIATRDAQLNERYTYRDLLPAALRYASQGFYVFPCWAVTLARGCECGKKNCNAGKHPIGQLARHGLNSATINPEVIKRWWARYAIANIGLACGPSNLIVIDIDPRNGGDATWADIIKRFGKSIERTLRVRTGSGGTHLYFRAPSRVALRSGAHVLGRGVDIKAHGGFVIAPPSYHKTGNFYVNEGGRLAAFPSALLKLLRQLERRSYENQAPVVEADPAAVAATRADLTKCLDQLRWRGNQATALCPAHDDNSPSFSVRILPDGDILLYCFAGCSYGDIMDAMRERINA